MSIEKKLTRRNFLGLLGLVSAEIAYSSAMVCASPPVSRGRIVSDGKEYVISRDYSRREYEWENDMKRDKSSPAKKPVPNSRGDIEISSISEGAGSIIYSPDNLQDEKLKLSPNYTIEDFKEVYGKGRWYFSLSIDEKQRIERVWNILTLKEREKVCRVYLSPYNFYKTEFNTEQKRKFDMLNHAYKYLFAMKKRKNPALEIFGSRDGSVTQYYKTKCPWIRVNREDIPLNVPDRVLVFYEEDFLERTRSQERLNWSNIERLSRKEIPNYF